MKMSGWSKLAVGFAAIVGAVIVVNGWKHGSGSTEPDQQSLAKRNADLNSGDYADTTLLHWSYAPEKNDYDVFMNNGVYCESVHYDDLIKRYTVYDPADPENDRLTGHIAPHTFPKLDDARAYLWSRCELKVLAKRIENNSLAPGEDPR